MAIHHIQVQQVTPGLHDIERFWTKPRKISPEHGSSHQWGWWCVSQDTKKMLLWSHWHNRSLVLELAQVPFEIQAILLLQDGRCDSNGTPLQVDGIADLSSRKGDGRFQSGSFGIRI